MFQAEICDPACRKFGIPPAGFGPGNVPLNFKINRNIQEITTTTFIGTIGPGGYPPGAPGGSIADTASSLQGFERKVVINLPAYIVNSHAITTDPSADISLQYNLQLKSPDNEDLFVNDHHVLLQVMSQYVYYRKLCIWIKDELKKKRLELLESARRALIDARDGQEICGCNPREIRNRSPDRLLTDVEKDFLQRVDAKCTDAMGQPAVCDTCYDKRKAKKGKCTIL